MLLESLGWFFPDLAPSYINANNLPLASKYLLKSFQAIEKNCHQQGHYFNAAADL